MSEGRYYWLKLKRDFFKRHDVRIVEAMPNGKDYILFYLKLLLESIDHEGMLRFNDSIPYSESMLSTITDTNIDVVRSAIKVFTGLGMMDMMDDGTLYMSEVKRMTGSASASDSAERVRRFRERQNQPNTLINSREALQNVTVTVTNNNESKSKSKNKSIEIKEKDKKKDGARFAPPSVDEVQEYIREKGYSVDAEEFYAHYESNGWIVGKTPMKNWKAAVVTWQKRHEKDKPKPAAQAPNYKRFDDRF